MSRFSALASRREFLSRLSAAAAASWVWAPRGSAAVESPLPSGRFEAKEFGARGDAQSLDTPAIQKAIDVCAQSGGGTVHFSPGRYLSGTLFLRSRVTIELESGATLLGSPKLDHYPPTVASIRSFTDTYTERSLIYGENLDQVSLQGRGVINGQGGAFKGSFKVRPYLIRMIGCRDVLVRDLTLKDSPMWVQHYLACEGVNLDGLVVASKCNGNNDGMDIDGSQRVRIANCDIQSGDDAIVLKSTLARPCRDVVITNCLLNSDCNAFKLGTESNGGFEDITLSNCVMYDTRLAGVALETVDGGKLDRVNISNVSMNQVRCPIFLRLGNRGRPFQERMPQPGVGSLRNVSITNVQATGADSIGCCLAGLPEHPIEGVSLRNLRLSFTGGGKEKDACREIMEKAQAYPEYSMFGILPAYGFYCRHVHGLELDDIEVSCASADARPSLWCEDVERLQVRGWHAPKAPPSEPVIRFENVRDALVESCRAPRDTGIYLRAGGSASARIRLQGNDLDSAKTPVETAREVKPGTMSLNP